MGMGWGHHMGTKRNLFGGRRSHPIRCPGTVNTVIGRNFKNPPASDSICQKCQPEENSWPSSTQDEKPTGDIR